MRNESSHHKHNLNGMFCKPFVKNRNKSNFVKNKVNAPVSLWFTGVLPLPSVDKSVENVDNFT